MVDMYWQTFSYGFTDQLSNAHNYTPEVACHRNLCCLFTKVVTNYYNHTQNISCVTGTNQSSIVSDEVKFGFCSYIYWFITV